jgi:hypothetical protein
MAKAKRKLVFALALVVVAVAALVAVRTLLFRSRQITPAVGAADLPLPAQVIERFAAAIRFKTISGDPAADEEFPRFREFLQRSFPRVHATLGKETSVATACSIVGQAGTPISNRYCSWDIWTSSRSNPTTTRSGTTRPLAVASPMAISGAAAQSTPSSMFSVSSKP